MLLTPIRVALLGASLLVALGLSAAHGDDRRKKADFAEAALDAAIHGEFKLRRSRVTLVYDFDDADQAKDFEGTSAFLIGELPEEAKKILPVTKVEVTDGRLRLQRTAFLRLAPPMKAIQGVRCDVTGLEDVRIRLESADGEQLNVWVGSITKMNTDQEGAGIFLGSNNDRRITLIPKKRHRIEIQVRRSSAITSLDGRKIMEHKLDREFPPLTKFAITTRSDGTPGLDTLQLQGVVAEELPVHANRGRRRDQLPPLWPQEFTAVSAGFRLMSPVSAEHAMEWLGKLDGAVQALRNGIEDRGDPTGDPVEVYVFRDPVIFEAYTEAKQVARLPWGPVAFLETAPPARAITPALRAWVEPRHADTADWWRMGLYLYYGQVSAGPKGLTHGAPREDLLDRVRPATDKPEDLARDLRRLIGGRKIETADHASLAWAFTHFLIHWEKGQYLAKWRAFGKPGQDAGALRDELFPEDRFESLCLEFVDHIDDL